MGRPLWQVKLIKKMWPTRYATAKAARLGPVGDWVRDHFLLGDRMTQIPINQEIQGIEPSMALPLAILEEFVREASVRVIMHECICRDNNHCRDYPRHLGCVFLGDAARDIHPRLGKQAGVEETLGHIRDAVSSGLVPFTGRNKLDTLWLGVGPGGRLLTICLCCPCCCLYSVFPHLPEHLRKGVVRMEGLEVEVAGECTGCGTCVSACLSRAISLEAGLAQIDPARCIGCGRCAAACPEHAIELRLTRPDAVELLKRRIGSVVEVR